MNILGQPFARRLGASLGMGQRGGGDTTPGGVADAYLTEDSFGFTLEDGSGVLLME